MLDNLRRKENLRRTMVCGVVVVWLWLWLWCGVVCGFHLIIIPTLVSTSTLTRVWQKCSGILLTLVLNQFQIV